MIFPLSSTRCDGHADRNKNAVGRHASGHAAGLSAAVHPAQVQDKWDCRYEIDWPEGTVSSHVQGNDALHALHLAELKIGTELYMSRYHHERKLRWIEPWEGYGFPLPKGARDLLIGHDREFYGD